MSNTSGTNEYQDLTQHEIQALKQNFNLADAHTHQSQSPTQQKIIERLPAIWYQSENMKQAESEQCFINAFFTGQGQHRALTTPTMLVYASSIAMVITANYLMQQKKSVALMNPCFDNLHDILKHLQITLEPLQEEWLHDPQTLYANLEKNIRADVLFVVDPNNPTGFTLTGTGKNLQNGFKELVRFAKDKNKLLIFDFCFASFLQQDSTLGIFDVYELLEDSGVSYITIEDTGKTWPLQDAKVALLKTSRDIYKQIFNIHTSYLLNVSPFILNLITEYVIDSTKDNFASVHDLLTRNRDIAKTELADTILEYQPTKARVSVAWFKITNSKISATELQKIIAARGAYVLPGTYFYWADRSVGENYLRIALARDTDQFASGIAIIKKILASL